MSRTIPPDPRHKLEARMARRSAAMLAKDLAVSKGKVDVLAVRLAILKAERDRRAFLRRHAAAKETPGPRPHQICHAARVSGSAWPQEHMALFVGR